MITADTAAQLEALATTIFHPDTLTGIAGQDDSIDAQFYALIAPVMLAIESRTMAPGFKYTLNETNASQGRPKHWYKSVNEYNVHNAWVSAQAPCYCGLSWVPDTPLGVTAWANSLGLTLAAAACAAICNAWAKIIRLWLAGEYSSAVNPPPTPAGTTP